jgi:hypothetical protein
VVRREAKGLRDSWRKFRIKGGDEEIESVMGDMHVKMCRD